ncbi:MAG: hypothetical protein AB7V43_06285 [Acidimicrobiia bacterium]
MDHRVLGTVRGVALVAVMALFGVGMHMTATADSASAATKPRVTFLGDSTMAATSWYDGMGVTHSVDVLDQRFDAEMIAESCRRIIGVSCTGLDRITGARYKPATVIDEMRARRGQLGDAVVIMAGYDDNDIRAGIDAVMAEANSQGIPYVIWINYRTTTSYNVPGYGSARGLFEKHNTHLAEKAAQYSNLIVEDWDGYTATQCNQPRTSVGAPGSRGMETNTGCWFWWDGIHITPVGTMALVEWLDRVVGDVVLGRCAIAGRSGEALPTTAPLTVTTPLSGFVSITPDRVADTRADDIEDPSRTEPLGAGRRLRVDLTGIAPASATAAAINLTSVGPCGPGYLTAHPCDGGVPGTSSLNVVRGQNVANAAIVRLGADQDLCVATTIDTDVLIDVVGWFTPAGARFTPSGPSRLVDTRTGGIAQLSVKGRRTAGQATELDLSSVPNMPANVSAVWLGIAGVDPAGAGFVSVQPCGVNAETSVLNVDPARVGGRVVSNAVLAPVVGGKVCVTTSSPMDLVIDVFGTFSPSGRLGLLAVTPYRLSDTRSPGGAGPNGALNGLSLPAVTGVEVLNVTAVNPTADGYVTVQPCGTTSGTSNVNYAARTIRPVMALGAADANGTCVRAFTAVDVVTDVTAVFVDPSA